VISKLLLVLSIHLALLALPGLPGIWARSFGFMFGDFQALHPHISSVDRQQVARVHRLKRRVHVWTANEIDQVRRLKSWGVDGIITDDPGRILESLDRTAA
jgi:glycerophosphoryl diester phosphodiesterase